MTDSTNFPTPPTAPGNSVKKSLLSPGTILHDGRFEIIKLLGQGSHGQVYQVYDRQTLETVVLKLFFQSKKWQQIKQALDTFSSIDHPNILRLYQFFGDDFYSLSMEFISGQSLRKIYSKKWKLSRIIDIVGQICRGLSFAHHSLIHCDIKPENILIDKDYRVKICDWGTVCDKKIGASCIAGTFPYIAPEQYEGKSIDNRADIYSVGVILYELLTGHFPIGNFELPSQLNPDLPTSIDTVVQKALQYHPQRRFSSAQQLAQALEQTIKSQSNLSWEKEIKRFIIDSKAAWSYRAYIEFSQNMHKQFPKMELQQFNSYLLQKRDDYIADFHKKTMERQLAQQKKIGKNMQYLAASGLLPELAIKVRGDYQQNRHKLPMVLAKEGFLPVDYQAVDKMFRRECQDYLKRRNYLMQQYKILQDFEQIGQYQECVNILSAMEERGLRADIFRKTLQRIKRKQKISDDLDFQIDQLIKEEKYQKAWKKLQFATQYKPFDKDIQNKLIETRQKIREQKYKRLEIMKQVLFFVQKKQKTKALSILDSMICREDDRIFSIRERLRAQVVKEETERKATIALWIGKKELRQVAQKIPANFSENFLVPAAEWENEIDWETLQGYQQYYADKHGLEIEKIFDLPDGEKIIVRLIPPVIFFMSKENIRRRTILPFAYYMAIYPVTQGQWEAINGHSHFINRGNDFALERVTWYESKKYADDVSLLTGERFDLPTEAEWHHACRPLIVKRTSGINRVGKEQSNAWGLYDMQGHIAQWCRDWQGRWTSEITISPCGPDEGQQKIIIDGLDSQSTSPLSRQKRTGFRLAYYPKIK